VAIFFFALGIAMESPQGVRADFHPPNYERGLAMNSPT